jgi:hypothetical protein
LLQVLTTSFAICVAATFGLNFHQLLCLVAWPHVQYMAWAELLLASALNPQASFMGHLAGIFAGMLHVRLLAPALPYLTRAWRRMQLQARVRLNPGQARFAAADNQQQQQQVRSAGAVSVQRQQAAEPARQRAAPAQQVPPAAVLQQQPQRREVAGAGNRLGGSGTAAAASTTVSSRAGDEVVVESSSRAQLSAEELRQRRLQRFG